MAGSLLPPVRFLSAPDGVRIAYCVHGSGPPLVFVRGWISHLEIMWDDESFRDYFGEIARHYQVIRYDARGNGVSGRDVAEITLEGLVLDLETVMDGLKLEEVVLYSAAFGGPIAIAYAARHPERVAKLILDGTYARGSDRMTPERQASFIAMLRDLPEAAEGALTFTTNPDPRPGRYGGPGSMWRATTPALAVQLYTLGFEVDVTELLQRITMPTLVMHRRSTRSIPFRLGRELASIIADARFVSLEGAAHNSWEGDAAAALRAVGEFLGVELALGGPPVRAGRAPVTILFTDIVSSTSLSHRLGDAQGHEVRREHDAIVRQALRDHGGSEIKHTGDGIMASFASASGALACAIAVQRAVAASPLKNLGVHIGVNAGEPLAEGSDLFGTSVDLARRLCDEAADGQILVSNVVRELAAGKGFRFTDRGEFVPKGFDDAVRLYEVDWRE